MTIESEIINRNYIFTQKQLQEKLGIKGDINNVELWSGLSPNEEENKKSRDKVQWSITTSEEF
jgi:hypothetical protein